MTIADTIWLATALLERDHPKAHGFAYEAILKKVFELNAGLKSVSVHAHLSAHCIASKKANPSTLRMLTENPDGTLRLFRPGDPFHPTRKGGRTQPKPHSIPKEYHALLRPEGSDADPSQFSAEEDPLLALAGVGKEMWRTLGGGDAFVRALREEPRTVLRPQPPLSKAAPLMELIEKLANRAPIPARARSFDDVWPRIESHAGEEFRTVTGKPFSYNVRGLAVVPMPSMGKETNRLLPRSHFQKAWERRPLSGPGQIHDLQGPTYVYAILADPRISGR